jgi:HEAT repeat protein
MMPARTRAIVQLRGAAFVAALALCCLAPLQAEERPIRVDSLLAEMQERGAQFPVEKLVRAGPETFGAVFDWLFPETAEVKELDLPDEFVGELIDGLGSENYQTREAATRRLRDLGPGAQRAVMRAVRSHDPEVSWRAVRVLRSWEDERRDDMSRFVPAMTVCLANVDQPSQLEEIARRTRAMLDLGLPAGGKQQILREMIVALCRTRDDRYLNDLRPLLEHTNSRVSTFVVQSISAGIARLGGTMISSTSRVVAVNRTLATTGDNDSPPYLPRLLLEALDSKRSDVQLAAVSAVPRRIPDELRDELRQRLTALRESDNATIKLRVCRPLIALYDDEGALDYVLEQALDANNRSRQFEAIGLLVSPEPPSKPIPKKMLETMQTLLKQTSLAHGRATVVSVLGGYAGEDIIAALVPLLVDNYQPVQQIAAQRLTQQPDKKALRKALEAAAGDQGNSQLKRQAEQILEQMGPAT